MPRIGWLAVGAVLGALVGAESPAAALAAAVALAAAFGVRRVAGVRRVTPRGRERWSLLTAVGIAAVAGRLVLAGTPLPPPTTLPSGSGPWEATVESIGTPRQGQQVATIALDAPADASAAPGKADAAAAQSSAAPDQSPLRLSATLPRYPALAPGDRIWLRGSLRAAGDDEYGRRQRRMGIAGTIRAPEMHLLPARGGATELIETIRRGAGDALARVLPEPQAGLAAGILIGLRERVDRDVAAAFTTAGVSHVVAISGWNIAIVGALVGAVLGRWPRRRRAVATVIVVAAYTLLAGASSSVVRAALMAAVVLVARESGRAGRAVSALGWAVVLLVVIDPAVVADAGFSLSVLATAGLLAWGSGLTRWFASLGGRRLLPGWIAENLGVSLAAQAWTLPVVLASFGRLALVAPLVNLVVVPLVAPVMAAGALALVGGLVAGLGVPIAGTLLALPAWVLLGAMIRLVEIGAALPFASLTLEPPSDSIAAAVAGSALLAAILGRRRIVAGLAARRPTDAARRTAPDRQPPHPLRRKAAIGLLAAVAIAVPFAGIARGDGRLHIVILDVGQGDAILIEHPDGPRLLVDGGPDPDRLLKLLDARFAPWDRRIDAIVLTHPHEDHVGGLPIVLERYAVGRVAEPGMPGAGPGYAAWRSLLDTIGVRADRLSTGHVLRLGNLALSVLWPDPDHVPQEASDDGAIVNASSIVLLGEVAGRRFLLTGDAEEGIDPFLLARGVPQVDVLKVAHHGSPTSSSEQLLDRLRPRAAIISVGEGNTYGHPGRATLTRLASVGAQVWRTDQNGTVDIAIGASGVVVTAEREGPAQQAARTEAAATALPADDRRGPAGIESAPGALLYHRTDGRSFTRRGRRAPARARFATVARPPLACRSRGGRVPRAVRRSATARPPPSRRR